MLFGVDKRVVGCTKLGADSESEKFTFSLPSLLLLVYGFSIKLSTDLGS